MTTYHTPAPSAIDPTTDELRTHAAEVRDDLVALLSDVLRWQDDVDRTFAKDDPRRDHVDMFGHEVATAADMATAGVLWIDRHPDVPHRADWSDRPDWAEDLRLPSETVQPTAAADLFNPAVHDDGEGEPWTWAEIKQAEHEREGDIVARSGELHARLHALTQRSATLAEDSVEWIDQADPARQPDMYAGYKLLADTERATRDAIGQVEAFEQDTLHVAKSPDDARPSTAALFAASTGELLTLAEGIQQRTHGWVDDVSSVHGADSMLYDRAELAAGSVDHTVASLREVSREFVLFDDPASEGTPVHGDTEVEAATWQDDVTEPSGNLPDRAATAETGGQLSVNAADLRHAVSALRDDATDWRLLAAVDEAGGDSRRIEHAHDAANALDEADASAEVGTRLLADLADDLGGHGPRPTVEAPVTETAEQADERAALRDFAVRADVLYVESLALSHGSQEWLAATASGPPVGDRSRSAPVDTRNALESSVDTLHDVTNDFRRAHDAELPPDVTRDAFLPPRIPPGTYADHPQLDGTTLERRVDDLAGGVTRLWADASEWHGLGSPTGGTRDEHTDDAVRHAHTARNLTGGARNRLRELDHAPTTADTTADPNQTRHRDLGADEVYDLDRADAQELRAGPSESQVIRGRVLGPDGRISDEDYVLHLDEPAAGAGARQGGREVDDDPFDDAASAHDRVSESVAAAENGLHEVRRHQALSKAQAHADDVARWHTADLHAEVERSRDQSPAIEPDTEPPF